MKKNIVKIVSFLLVFSFLFVKISYVLRPHEGAASHIHAYGMEPPNTVDMVYFGGSSCFTYWAPMEAWGEYGITSFNFANNTMPAQVEKHCIIEALKTQSPKLIVVDVRPFEYAENPAEDGSFQMYKESSIRNFSDGLRYSLNRGQMIENSVPKENGRVYYHLDLAKYHTNLTALVLKNHWKYAFHRPDDASKNFGGFDFYKLYAPISAPNNSHITEEIIFSEELDYLYNDLVSYCAGLGISVLFIVPPYEESEEYHKKHNYMRRIAEKNGIPFLDCNDVFDEIGLDPRLDFYNGSHTQIFGAKKYTKWFGQYIRDTFSLPDRRGDSLYEDWNTAYQLWLQQCPEVEQAVYALMPEDMQKLMDEKEG